MTKFTCLIFLVLMGMALCKDCDYKGTTIKDGQSITPKGKCSSVRCNNGDVFPIKCPEIGIPYGCKVKYEGIDLTKPYPACCGKAYCP